MATTAIQTTGLTKYYGTNLGVADLDLEVGRGEVFGFLGPNGAGKTTTIRLLLDLIRPSSGSIEVLGLEVAADSVAIRRRIGYLPGELNLYERLRAGELLEFLGRLRGGVERERIRRMAERLGLDLSRQIDDLSKGNKQKVGVVAAFMHDPELLILDEPTSGLDPLRQHDVHELIRERVAEGGTVFLSTHALDEASEVADRVGIIREGRLVGIEQVAALRERTVRELEVAFDGPVPELRIDELDGVTALKASDGRLRLRVEGPMDQLVKELARHPVRTLTSQPPELEEVFLSYYGDPDED